MNPFLFLKGETLGKTIYNVVVAVLIVAVLAWFGWTATKAKFWEWRADHNATRAEHAEANVVVAQRNATNATGAAQNATQTRAAMDTATATTRANTAAAVKRINDHASTPVADSGEPDASIMRELTAAHDRARTAADRLRGAGAR